MFRIGAEGVTVRYRLGLSVNHELVGIFPVRLAIERRAPAAKYLLQPLFWNAGELADCFDAHRSQGCFGHSTDSRNAPHGKRT